MKFNALQQKRQLVRHKNIIGIDPGLSRQSSVPSPTPRSHIDLHCVRVECNAYSLCVSNGLATSRSGSQFTKLSDSTDLLLIVLRFKTALGPLLLVHIVDGRFFFPSLPG